MVRDVAAGELRVPADVLSRVFAAIRAEAAEGGKSLGGLTQRELEILESFCRGMSYAKMAEEREVLPVTVRNAVYGIQRKLGLGSKQEVVVWAARTVFRGHASG